MNGLQQVGVEEMMEPAPAMDEVAEPAPAEDEVAEPAPAEGGGPIGAGSSEPSPLFLAEVDDIDTSAVLALLAVIPTSQGKGLRVFERRDGAWTEVPDYVQRFKSVNPPTVVELDRETLLAVVEQLDASDAEK